MIHQTFMTPQDKKKFIQKQIDEGNKKGWNAIAADLELRIWTERYHPNPTKQKNKKAA